MRIMTKKYHQNQHFEKTFLVIRLGSNFMSDFVQGDFVLIPTKPQGGTSTLRSGDLRSVLKFGGKSWGNVSTYEGKVWVCY